MRLLLLRQILILCLIFYSTQVNAQKKELNAVNTYYAHIDKVMDKAHVFFEKVIPVQNSLVIFDIDETSLDTHNPTGQVTLLNRGKLVHFNPIVRVLELYKSLVVRCFKVIFLTARIDKSSPSCAIKDVLEATKKNLIAAGYTQFEDVICRTFQDRASVKIFEWKEKMRKALSLRYIIVATFEDDAKNLTGDCTGEKIQLPRMPLGKYYIV